MRAAFLRRASDRRLQLRRAWHRIGELLIGSTDDEFEAALRAGAEEKGIPKEHVDRAVKAWRER